MANFLAARRILLLYHGIIVDFVEYSMKNSTDVPDIRWAIPLNFYSATIGVYAKFSSSRNSSTYIYIRGVVVVDRSVNSYLNGGIAWREQRKREGAEKETEERKRT